MPALPACGCPVFHTPLRRFPPWSLRQWNAYRPAMNRGFWFTSGVLAGTIVGFGSALVFTQQQADTQSLAEADAEVEDADVMLAAQMQR